MDQIQRRVSFEAIDSDKKKVRKVKKVSPAKVRSFKIVEAYKPVGVEKNLYQQEKSENINRIVQDIKRDQYQHIGYAAPIQKQYTEDTPQRNEPVQYIKVHQPDASINDDMRDVISDQRTEDMQEFVDPRHPEMVINVNLAKGKVPLTVYENDDPHYLATNFCMQHGITDPVKQKKLMDVVVSKVREHRMPEEVVIPKIVKAAPPVVIPEPQPVVFQAESPVLPESPVPDETYEPIVAYQPPQPKKLQSSIVVNKPLAYYAQKSQSEVEKPKLYKKLTQTFQASYKPKV